MANSNAADVLDFCDGLSFALGSGSVSSFDINELADSERNRCNLSRVRQRSTIC